MPRSIQYEMRPQYCFLPRQSVKQLTSCLLVGTDNRHGEDPGEEKHRCVTGKRCCRNTSQTLSNRKVPGSMEGKKQPAPMDMPFSFSFNPICEKGDSRKLGRKPQVV